MTNKYQFAEITFFSEIQTKTGKLVFILSCSEANGIVLSNYELINVMRTCEKYYSLVAYINCEYRNLRGKIRAGESFSNIY